MTSENSVAEQVAIRENKLELVERLADDLAHEIKNPLHSMAINLEVLRRRIAGLESVSNEELLRYAGVIGAELDRLNRRVDLLLRMVRPHRESDEPTTLPEVMEDLRELVELECERHDVSLEMESPASRLRERLPRAATRQMILSLILKTLDSLATGSTLRVTADFEPGWLRLSVRGFDPGAKPPPSDAEAEDPFLRVARTLAERLGGSVEPLQDLQSLNSSADSGGPTGFLLSLPAP